MFCTIMSYPLSCHMALFQGRHEQMSTHSWLGNQWKYKSEYQQIKEFIGVTYKNMGEELQEQEWLIYSSITKTQPQHGWCLMKAGNLGLTAQFSGILTDWRVSSGQHIWCEPLPSSSAGHCFFLVSLSHSVSSRQLICVGPILGSSACLRMSLQDAHYL